MSAELVAHPEETSVALRPAYLEARGLVKRFIGTLALDHADLSVDRGEIHALLGANGAGKSTIIKILAGVYRADEGEIRIDGKQVDPYVQQLPLAFIHQDLAVFEGMTVAENFALTLGFPRRSGLIAWRKLLAETREALDSVGADIDPSAILTSLSLADKSIVAIARALSAPEVRMLVLDEPTASLSERDVARLFDTLRILKDRGVAMLFVTHRLDEVFRIADHVTIVRDGRRISSSPTTSITRDTMVAEIVGRETAAVLTKARASLDAPMTVQLGELCTSDAGPVSIQIKAGEIVGFVGVRGGGQESIGRALFAINLPTSGTVRLSGHEGTMHDPLDAIRHGIGFVSSKRTEEAIAITLSVRENLFLSHLLGGRGNLEFVGRRDERTSAQGVLAAFDIRPRDPEVAIGTLSGGNQQRVVLARWLAPRRCKLLILEDPTLGVDVGAKIDLYNELTRMVQEGLSIVLVSSDFDEVCTLCDRALVFNHGQVVAEFDREQLSTNALTNAASADTLTVGSLGSRSESET